MFHHTCINIKISTIQNFLNNSNLLHEKKIYQGGDTDFRQSIRRSPNVAALNKLRVCCEICKNRDDFVFLSVEDSCSDSIFLQFFYMIFLNFTISTLHFAFTITLCD
jgi:hypothetical protein